jgi:hypothetical protein
MHALLQNYNISLWLLQLLGKEHLTAMLQQFSLFVAILGQCQSTAMQQQISLSVATLRQSKFDCNTTSILSLSVVTLWQYTFD